MHLAGFFFSFRCRLSLSLMSKNGFLDISFISLLLYWIDHALLRLMNTVCVFVSFITSLPTFFLVFMEHRFPPLRQFPKDSVTRRFFFFFTHSEIYSFHSAFDKLFDNARPFIGNLYTFAFLFIRGEG